MKVDALSPADEDLEPSEWEFVLEATTPCDLFEPVLKSEDDAEDWLSSLHQNDLEVSGLEFIGSPCITTPDLDRFISPRDENADPWRYVEVGSHTRRKMTSAGSSIGRNVLRKKMKCFRSRNCQVKGCIRRSRSRNLCKRHGGGKRCTFEACNRSDQGGGFCIAHGGGKRCTIFECRNAAQSRGLCKSHGGGKRCTFSNCNKSSQSGEFCRFHSNSIPRDTSLSVIL